MKHLCVCLVFVALALSARADGGSGNALHFDAVDAYVSVLPNSAFNSFPLSVTARVRTIQASGPVDLASKPSLEARRARGRCRWLK